MTYTVIIYKKDKRTKEGERRVHYSDYETTDLKTLEHTVKHTWRAGQGFRYEIHETYVKRTNLMGGAEYTERFDTPRYCSPAQKPIGVCKDLSVDRVFIWCYNKNS